jgi:nitrite reductase (NO-forming)
MSHLRKTPLHSVLIEGLNYGVIVFLAGGIGFWGLSLMGGFYKQRFGNGEAKLAPAKTEMASTTPVTPASSTSVGAAPPPETVAATPVEVNEVGKQVYNSVCIACHQPTGLGLPNMFPPLAETDWVNAAKPDRLIRIVLHGLMGPIKINNEPFTSAAPLMPPQGSALSDEQIAGVLTFVRQSFGNASSAVSAAEVKAVREAEKSRAAMWTSDELDKSFPLN